MTFDLPDDVARAIFAHLNGDEGWRNELASRLEVMGGRRTVTEPERRKLAELQRTVVALGVLSGSLARAQQGGKR